MLNHHIGNLLQLHLELVILELLTHDAPDLRFDA